MGDRAAVGSHEAVARLGVEAPRAGIGFGHDAVHVGRGGQALKVFAARLHVEGAVVHAVQVDQVERDAAVVGPAKEDVGAAIVFVGQVVFVQAGRHAADGAQHVVHVAERALEELLVAVGTARGEAHVEAAVEAEAAAQRHVGHGSGGGYAQAAQQQGVVERALGLGGAQRAVDPAVHHVGPAEHLDHHALGAGLHEAQLVASTVDHPALAPREAFGQRADEGGQRGKVGVDHEGAMVEDGHAAGGVFRFCRDPWCT